MVNAILFKKVDYSLSKLILDIEHGDIGLPDIQRPFVWETGEGEGSIRLDVQGFSRGLLSVLGERGYG